MRKRRIIVLIAMLCVLLAMFGLVGCSTQSFASDEEGIASLIKAMEDAANSSENYYHSTYKVKGEANSKGLRADDVKTAFYQNNGKGNVYMSVGETINKLTEDKFLATGVTYEYWNSLMYETKADKDSKDDSKKKNLTVIKESHSTDRLEGSKKMTDNTSKASYVEGGVSNIVSLSVMITPYLELIKDSDAYNIIEIKREGKIDYYYIEVKAEYNEQLNRCGILEFTALNTESYTRISSISNINDSNDTKVSDKESLVINFSYARPSMNTIECAEEYVNSINTPQVADKTAMYVYIGLGVGLGVPLIALLLWFIIKKARFFKDFDPDEMDMDDYIAMKKGKPLPSKQLNSGDAIDNMDAEMTVKTEENISEDVDKADDGGNGNV